MLPDLGGPVIFASLSGTAGSGLWAVQPDAALTLLVKTGSQLPSGDELKTVKSINVFPLAPSSLGQSRSFDPSTGRVVYQATFTDKTWGICRADRSGILAGKAVVAIAGGGHTSLVLCADGRLANWGLNSSFELGNGNTTTTPEPVFVATSGSLADKTVVSVAGGGGHSLALCSDGTVFSWGAYDAGNLGDGGQYTKVPVAVDRSGALAGKTVVAVSAGDANNLALCSDGTLVTWGYDILGDLNGGYDINQTPAHPSPVTVSPSGALSGKRIVAIAAGSHHDLVLCSDGTLATWGQNDNGELGTGSQGFWDYTSPSATPVAVDMTGVLAGKTIVQICALDSLSLALCSDGTVATWGDNSSGQLGNGTNTRSVVPGAVDLSGALAGKQVVSVSTSGHHCLALCSDGTVVAWGANAHGELGNGTFNNSSVPVAVDMSGVLAGKPVVSVCAANSHSLALCSDGTVATWGSNGKGELGNGTFVDSAVPVAVDQ